MLAVTSLPAFDPSKALPPPRIPVFLCPSLSLERCVVGGKNSERTEKDLNLNSTTPCLSDFGRLGTALSLLCTRGTFMSRRHPTVTGSPCALAGSTRGEILPGLPEPASGEKGPLGPQQRSQNPKARPPAHRQAAASPSLDRSLELWRPPLSG